MSKTDKELAVEFAIAYTTALASRTRSTGESKDAPKPAEIVAMLEAIYTTLQNLGEKADLQGKVVKDTDNLPTW